MKLLHPDDVKNDNLGTWSHSGSHPQLYKVQVEENCVWVEWCCPGVTGNGVVYLRQLHNVHPSKRFFKCMIAFVSDESLFFVL